MKSSNVLWLGDIPEHWECLKIGILFSQRKVKVSDKDYAPLSVTKMGILPQLESAAKSDDSDNRKLVCAGDFVINSRSDRKGSCGISELNGSVSLINLVLTPRNEWNNRYVHYLMRSQPFSEEYYRYGRGIVADLWTTRFSEMKNILLPVPPREEQDRIVRFLDWKVSEINRLIHCRKRQIERLEELKKAVVSRAVNNTKWKSVSLKKCLYSISDIDHFMPQSVENGYPYVMTGDLMQNASDIDFLKCKQISQEDYFKLSKKSKPQKDDVIFARYATIGTVCYVDKDIDFLVSYSCVTLKHNNLILGKYLFYYLKSDTFMQNVNQYIKINTQGNVGMESIRNVKIPIPPIEEQQQIVAYLDEQLKKIDSAIANKQKQIETLQELKTRLISDVVTGKTDVRGIAIPEYVHTEESGEIEESEEVPENGKEEN